MVQQKLSCSAIVFDLDDVLVDVTHSCRLAVKKTSEFFLGRILGQEEIQDAMQSCCSTHFDAADLIIKNQGGSFRKDVIVKKFQEFYLGRNLKGLMYNEQLLVKPELLKNLKKHKLAVIAGRPKQHALEILQKFNVARHFREILGSEDIPEPQPNPAGIYAAMLKLKSQGKTAAVGCCLASLKASQEAHVPFIGIIPPSANKKNYREMLKREGAAYVLESVNELREIV
ncbi:HAD family hydrolase [Candidatus Woesearchaeota archaeon]|nr:HAD family hydrolase [Candidatus Woesearchaeota archaeon]